jgi:hypothetical protein
MAAKISKNLRSEPNMKSIIARVLRQSKSNEYIIIDKKIGDGHRSKTENKFAHAL